METPQDSFYRVTMASGLCVTVAGLLCLQLAGATDSMETVSHVTNGSRSLTLTCPEATDPDARYNWFTPEPNTTRCVIGPTDNVCTFNPTIKDDNKTVTCAVFDSKSNPLHRNYYLLNLTYPPQSDPQIKPHKREASRQNITCTVSGGKPPVANVTFRCQSSDLPDQLGDVSRDGNVVNSSITVNVPEKTNVNVSCWCSAFWAPEPALYSSTKKYIVSQESNKQSRVISSAVQVASMVVVVFMFDI